MKCRECGEEMYLDDKDISGKFITIFLVLNDIDTDPF